MHDEYPLLHLKPHPFYVRSHTPCCIGSRIEKLGDEAMWLHGVEMGGKWEFVCSGVLVVRREGARLPGRSYSLWIIPLTMQVSWRPCPQGVFPAPDTSVSPPPSSVSLAKPQGKFTRFLSALFHWEVMSAAREHPMLHSAQQHSLKYRGCYDLIRKMNAIPPLCTWPHSKTTEGIPRLPNADIVG